MIQVGLVGVGPQWERYHPALSRLRRPIHVEAVYDPVFARAESAARDLDADPVHGIRALAARGNVEAILVMDPTWTRPSILPLLARQEKPVFFAASLLDGSDCHQQLKSLQTDSDGLIMPAIWRRFMPAAIRLQELIATELGRPQEITIDLAGQTSFHSYAIAQADATAQKSVPDGVAVPTLESIVGWLDFCRNLFRAFPVSASLSPAAAASTSTPSAQLLELRIVYPQAGRAADPQGAKRSAEQPGNLRQPTARLLIKQDDDGSDNAAASQFSAASFMRHLLNTDEHSPIIVAPSATVVVPPEFPKISLRCERGTAEMASETQIRWQSNSLDPVEETLASERTKEEIMLDIFCRRVVGGLIPVADLNDILKPLQLLRSCLEA